MFFTYIDQVLTPGVDLNLTISKTATGLTVLVMPRVNGLNDPAQNRLIPLTISASPQELDANFFPTIAAPIQKTSGMLVNIEAYERQQQEAEKSSKAAKDSKDRDAKEAKEKKDKYDAAVKKAEELEEAGKSEQAIAQYSQAKLHATEKATKTVDDKIAAIRQKLNQGSLFDAPVTDAKPEVMEQQVQQQAVQPVQIQPTQAVGEVQQPIESVVAEQQIQQQVAEQQIADTVPVQVQKQVLQPEQIQQQVAEPAQIEHLQPVVQVQQPYVPVQQPIQHPSAMHPNLDFGVFGSQQSPQPTQQQQTQQQSQQPTPVLQPQQPIQQQVPQQQPAKQRSTIPAFYPPQNTEVEWKNDYEDIIDFPQEMRPPVFIPRVQTASAVTI